MLFIVGNPEDRFCHDLKFVDLAWQMGVVAQLEARQRGIQKYKRPEFDPHVCLAFFHEDSDIK